MQSLYTEEITEAKKKKKHTYKMNEVEEAEVEGNGV